MAETHHTARDSADLPPTRVTDEWLLYARRNPTKLAAWTLRSIIDELIDRRLTEKEWWTPNRPPPTLCYRDHWKGVECPTKECSWNG